LDVRNLYYLADVYGGGKYGACEFSQAGTCETTTPGASTGGGTTTPGGGSSGGGTPTPGTGQPPTPGVGQATGRGFDLGLAVALSIIPLIIILWIIFGARRRKRDEEDTIPRN
jgi:hypothetical protein